VLQELKVEQRKHYVHVPQDTCATQWTILCTSHQNSLPCPFTREADGSAMHMCSNPHYQVKPSYTRNPCMRVLNSCKLCMHASFPPFFSAECVQCGLPSSMHDACHSPLPMLRCPVISGIVLRGLQLGAVHQIRSISTEFIVITTIVFITIGGQPNRDVRPRGQLGCTWPVLRWL
jgi:hypothetical protein